MLDRVSLLVDFEDGDDYLDWEVISSFRFSLWLCSEGRKKERGKEPLGSHRNGQKDTKKKKKFLLYFSFYQRVTSSDLFLCQSPPFLLPCSTPPIPLSHPPNTLTKHNNNNNNRLAVMEFGLNSRMPGAARRPQHICRRWPRNKDGPRRRLSSRCCGREAIGRRLVKNSWTLSP